MTSVDCYAQRLLNPFRGAMHTIQYASAEAATLDGVNWDIYVADEELLSGLEVSRWTQVTEIRYGKWSAEHGLKRGPQYPSDDFLRMEALGEMVWEYLTRIHHQAPFPFRDRYELWLLDAQRQPLALLDSAVAENSMDLDQSIEWHAGMLAREHFRSAAMPSHAADYLEQYIKARAGAHPAAQWFHRRADGSGESMQGIHPGPSHAPRILHATAFPPLLLSASGHDPMHQRLIEDFHAWQAPWLLMLPNLDTAIRRALEQKAREQAMAMFRLYRLYPEVVDQMGLKAALVEAVMQRSQGMSEINPDETMPTYYIELANNPGPVD